MELIKQIVFFIQYVLNYPRCVLRHNNVSIKSRIMPHVFMRNTTVGDYCFIGSYCDISYANIGNYTCIANGVVIGGMEHPYWELSISPKLSKEFIYGKITTIGHDVWIATGSIVKQGVHIGDGAVIGANSYVNQDVPAYSIVFGTPAKLYMYRDAKQKEELLNKTRYWELAPSEAIQKLKSIKYE